MANSIETYLNELKSEMKGSDIATIQDALSDAEEHLSTALKNQQMEQPELDSQVALAAIIEQYGTPAETASAYKEVERRTSPALVRPASADATIRLTSGSVNVVRTRTGSPPSEPKSWPGSIKTDSRETPAATARSASSTVRWRTSDITS